MAHKFAFSRIPTKAHEISENYVIKGGERRRFTGTTLFKTRKCLPPGSSQPKLGVGKGSTPTAPIFCSALILSHQSINKSLWGLCIQQSKTWTFVVRFPSPSFSCYFWASLGLDTQRPARPIQTPGGLFSEILKILAFPWLLKHIFPRENTWKRRKSAYHSVGFHWFIFLLFTSVTPALFHKWLCQYTVIKARSVLGSCGRQRPPSNCFLRPFCFH